MHQLVTVVVPAASLTPILVSGFDFYPEVVIAFYGGRSELVDTTGALDCRRGVGAAIDVETQVSTFSYIDENGNASNNESGLVDGSLVSASAGGRAKVVALQDGSFILAPTVAFAQPIAVSLLVLGENIVTQKALVIETDRNAAGPQNINVGFTPAAALFVGAHGDPIDTSFSSLSVGFAAGPSGSIDQFGFMTYSRGNGASSDARRWGKTGYVYAVSSEVPNNDVTAERASVSDWTGTGIALDYDQAIADDHQFFVLALDGPNFAVSSILAGQGRSDDLGFVPHGGVFLSGGLSEDADPDIMQRDDLLSIGASSLEQVGADQAAHATRNQDGPTLQLAYAAIDHDAILTLPDDLGAEDLAIGMGSPVGNRLSFQVQSATVPAPWLIAFLAFGDPVVGVTNNRLTTVPADPTNEAGSAKPLRTFLHDPDEFLDYQFDWSAVFLDENGVSQDTIRESIWLPQAGVTVADNQAPSNTATRTKAWLLLDPSVTEGQRILVVNRITTVAGRIYDRSIRLKVGSR